MMRGGSMEYSEKDIKSLRERVKARLSEKRFNHTLGVEAMAARIGEMCLPEKVSGLRVAAFLHDVSKEYSEAEHLEIAKKHNIVMTDDDLASPALWHSFTAPAVVCDEFFEFASDEILGAIRNHTAGSPDMSIFDEIIFLSDYIEEGRTFTMCTEVRQEFFERASAANSREDYILALHHATVSALNNTIKWFVSRGKAYHERTKATRDAILAKTERQNNGSN